jgi:hypothetical protein
VIGTAGTPSQPKRSISAAASTCPRITATKVAVTPTRGDATSVANTNTAPQAPPT